MIPHTLLQGFCLQRGDIMHDSCQPRSSPGAIVVYFQRKVNGNIFCLFMCFISLAHCYRATCYRVYHNTGSGNHFHCWPYHYKKWSKAFFFTLGLLILFPCSLLSFIYNFPGFKIHSTSSSAHLLLFWHLLQFYQPGSLIF